MSYYRRANMEGGTFFFTVVSYRRQAILCDQPIRNALRAAIKTTQAKHPFSIDAWVLLPDHLHCIWTMPKDDSDYAKRWRIIKQKVSIVCADQYKNKTWITASKTKHRESTIWQRRYWEHQIRDQLDFNNHVDYMHHNPVKHQLCDKPVQWPYSTLHRYIKEGIYKPDWTVEDDGFDNAEFGE